ncbi:MAG TPA: phosphoglycerate kinase [Candidatus Moranbacteria bacterium]|nr:phosphoglycerate kinase [Candidatus Moranbacteria bacterium]
MRLKKIQTYKFKNKKVLLRAGLNVPIENGEVREDYKIEVIKDTIDFIISQGGKVAVVSHLGRPLEYHKNNPGAEWAEQFSLRQILPNLRGILNRNIKFVESCHSNVIKKNLENSAVDEIVLLENIRFYEEEKNNNIDFARKLAENFDVFVNDAFGVCHREQSSVVGVTKFLPAFAGLQLQREVKNLERVKKYPEHPAVAIIGGAKITTKLPLIEALSENYDFILVGGKIANEAIDQNINFNSRVILPVDFVGKGRFDIGEYTVKEFLKIISQAETIVWNGPLGLFEKKPYDEGTMKIMEAIVQSGAFSVVGGGESVEAVQKNNLADKFSFVSTGGGAMLEFLSNGPMPGLEVLIDDE